MYISDIKTKNILIILALLLALFAGFSAIGHDNEEDSKVISFKNGICLRVNMRNSEIEGVRTTPNRIGEANSFKVRLQNIDEKDSISLSFTSADKIREIAKRSVFYSNCDFIESSDGFQEQIDGYGFCSTIGSSSVYHSQPNSWDNIIVQCLKLQPNHCRMSFLYNIESVHVRPSVSMINIKKKNWMSVASQIRMIISENVDYMPNCN